MENQTMDNPTDSVEIENSSVESSTVDTSSITEDTPLVDLSDEELSKLYDQVINGAELEAVSKSEPVDSAAEDTQSAQTDMAKEAKKVEPTASPEGFVSKEEHQRALLEAERYREQIAQQEYFIKRKVQEFATLKNSKIAENERLNQSLEDLAISDPRAAVRAELKIQNNEKEIQKIDQEHDAIVRRYKNQETVARYIKPNEVTLDEMAECLHRDGLEAQHIAEFQRDPYGWADAPHLIHLANRAKAESLVRRIVPAFQKLLKENAELKSNSTRIIQKVNEATRTPSTISARAGSATVRGEIGAEDYSPEDLAKLSDADLAELKKRYF